MMFKTKTDRTIANVQETYDYSKFRTLKGNRITSSANLSRIIESMKETPLMSPIIVNEKFEIIDGQHRFLACEKLELPVYYIECSGYSLPEVQILNANSKNWTNVDYLNSYCELGYPEYIKVRNFMRRHKCFSISVAINLLTLASNDSFETKDKVKRNTFRNGIFKCKDLQVSEEIASHLVRLRMFTDLFNRRTFVAAYTRVFQNPNFKPNVFFDKIKKYPTLIEPCLNTEQYLLMFEKIYNYRNTKKVSIRY